MEKNQGMQPQPQYPPPAYPGPPLQTTATVISGPPVGFPSMGIVTVASCPAVGPNPYRMTCPSCQAEIVTKVEHKATTRTHLLALCLCILCLPLVVLPYCIDSCNNANHFCPNCSSYIGTYVR